MKMKAKIILATLDQVEVEGKNQNLEKNELKKWENRPLTRKEMKSVVKLLDIKRLLF